MLLFISISNKFSNKSLHISFIISYIQKFSILSKKNIKTETNQKQKRIQSSYLHININNCNKLKWNDYHRYPISNEISIPKKYHVQAYFPNYAPISNFICISLYPISTTSPLHSTIHKTFSTSDYITWKNEKKRTTQNTKQRYSYNIYCRRITIPSHKFRLHTHKFAHDRVSASSSYLPYDT